MTLTQTGETSSNEHAAFVREGRESANVPARPQAVVDSMEAAFDMPIDQIDKLVGLKPDQIDAMKLGKEAASDMIHLETAPKPSPLETLKAVFLKGRERIDFRSDAGEVKPIIPVVGGIALIALAGMWVIGQHNNVNSQQEQQAANATASAQAVDAQKAAIDKAATSYTAGEQLIGSFTIGSENPNVTEGAQNYLESHPGIKIDPANVNLGPYNTIQESGVAVGTVNPGDQIQLVEETVDGHDVVIAERALASAQPLSPDGTIPAPQTH